MDNSVSPGSSLALKSQEKHSSLRFSWPEVASLLGVSRLTIIIVRIYMHVFFILVSLTINNAGEEFSMGLIRMLKLVITGCSVIIGELNVCGETCNNSLLQNVLLPGGGQSTGSP